LEKKALSCQQNRTSDDEKNGTVRNTKEVREHQWERQQRENQVTVIKDYQLL
jgi:hypothetical protein